MTKTINIEGMMCGHCEEHVKKALENLSGVSGAVVSHESGTAVVTLSEEVADDIADYLKGCDLGGYNLIKFHT